MQTATTRLQPTRLKQPTIDFVRPLAEYNGAGLRSSNVSFYQVKVGGKVAIQCDWCRHAARVPFLSCNTCKVHLCAHAIHYAYDKVGAQCAKHAT